MAGGSASGEEEIPLVVARAVRHDPNGPQIARLHVSVERCNSPISRGDSNGSLELPVAAKHGAHAMEAAAGRLSPAAAPLREAALKWLRTFTAGISPFTEACTFEGGQLVLALQSPLGGEIATRSRVPVCYELERAVRLTPSVDTDGEIVFAVDGMVIGPVRGAAQAYAALERVWEAAALPADDVPARAEAGWAWWKAQGADALEGTKLWRIVDSLAGLRSASLVPSQGFYDLLMGCVCVTRTRPVELRFSFFHPEGRAARSRLRRGGGSKGAGGAAADDSHSVQVNCTTRPDPAMLDAASAVHDAAHEWKQVTARGISQRNSAPSKRDLAEKFARSGINFSLLFGDVRAIGVRGAQPDAVAKLFEDGSGAMGGAGAADRMLGATKWQKDDPTFKMTGDAGRIVWSALGSRGSF